jgi:hypothetical protein
MLSLCESGQKSLYVQSYPLAGGARYEGDSPGEACAALSVAQGVPLTAVSSGGCTMLGGGSTVYPVVSSCNQLTDPMALDSSVIGYVYAWAFGAVLAAFLMGYAVSVVKKAIEKL